MTSYRLISIDTIIPKFLLMQNGR